MAMPITTQIAIKVSRRKRPHCLTRSAFDRNLIAMAISRKPSTTFTEFSHPPDFGRDCNQFGKMAKTVNGKASANPKPARPAVNRQEPCAAVPASSDPRIGPVHENETMASVKAMKKIPTAPRPDFELAWFARPPGSVISKYPKNDK